MWRESRYTVRMSATADLPTLWKTLGDHSTRIAVLEEHDDNADKQFEAFREELRTLRNVIIGAAVTVCLTAIGTCATVVSGLPTH